MANTRVELPRDHWVEVRDPWDITDKERTELRIGVTRRRQATVGTTPDSGPTPAPPAAPDDEAGLKEFRGDRDIANFLLASLVVAWGGPLLDDKEPSADTAADLPLPLHRALNKAVRPPLVELFPELRTPEDDKGPTTP